MFYRKHEHFSIADLARFCCGDYDVNRLFDHIVRHHHFDFYFREKIHRVLAPSVDFGVSLLPAKTGKIGDGKVFVLPVEHAVRIRTEEIGEKAV